MLCVHGFLDSQYTERGPLGAAADCSTSGAPSLAELYPDFDHLAADHSSLVALPPPVFCGGHSKMHGPCSLVTGSIQTSQHPRPILMDLPSSDPLMGDCGTNNTQDIIERVTVYTDLLLRAWGDHRHGRDKELELHLIY